MLEAGARTRSAATAVSLALLTTLLSLWSASAATASTVTVGPDLTGLSSGGAFTCEVPGGCSFSQGAPSYTSPVSGVIVRWRVISSGGPLTLRVFNGSTGGAIGPTATATSKSLQEFPAALPIGAGEQIGVDLPENGSSIAYLIQSGASIPYWSPGLAPGAARAPDSTTKGFQLLLNADVQPAPGISSLTPASTTIRAGAPVTISGHDLTGASAVMFGTAPSPSFNVSSDGQITAIAPPSKKIGPVPVTVTTIAGTATAPQPFAYLGCRVPKLRKLKVKAAKKRIKAAGCKVGRLAKRKGATAKSGKVAKQKPKPGAVVVPGTKVSLTVKP